jgi:hypothetical protein
VTEVKAELELLTQNVAAHEAEFGEMKKQPR